MAQFVSSTDDPPLPPYQAVMSSDRVSFPRSPSNHITSERSAKALLFSTLPQADFDIGYRSGDNAIRRAKFLLQNAAPNSTSEALIDILLLRLSA